MTTAPATSTATAGIDPLREAREVVPLIRAHADEAEQARRLPRQVIDALRARGLLTMGVPRSLGGLQTPLPTALRVLEEVARTDGSAAWIVMISFDSALLIGCVAAPDARREVAARSMPFVTSSVNPPGQIERVGGGYRLSGRWRLGSGCQDADLFVLAAVLCENGEPVIADGDPSVLEVVVPVSEVHILDTWDVTGLRATGSHDFEIHDLTLTDGSVQRFNFREPVDDGPLYRFPILASFAAAKAAIAFGIARHAIDTVKEVAATKRGLGERDAITTRSRFQSDLAHAEALLRSGQAFLYQTVDEGWEQLERGADLGDEQVAVVRLAAVSGVEQAVRATDCAFTTAATSAIYRTSPLERCFRDVHTIPAHITVQSSMWEAAGRVLLGLPPGTPAW